jgi:hypothetical protein
MTGLLARVGAWLVEPAPTEMPARDTTAVARPHADAAAPEVAVLAPASDVHALACGLALRLTRGPAVVAVWTGESPAAPLSSVPAVGVARRLASALAARDIAVTANGRLVSVALPAGETESAALAERVCATSPSLPVVLGVSGPRGDAWDQALVDRDLVVVHAAGDAIADLTVARLAEQGADAVRLTSPPGPLARALARAGLALPGGLDGLAAAAEAAR